ncbi:alkaline phosphatase family protein [Trichloromonas sp.]|uniref:alkaline phosphatase family protein n=1 Tax=Trichloromonas sp. TaxID=3069249 RepID=UPI003D816AAB
MPGKHLNDRLFRAYYFLKFYLFRKERQARKAAGPGRGFVGIQIDGLSYPHLKMALARGYLPNIQRHLNRGFVAREYQAGLPSTTPAAQAAIFYGDSRGIPAFRWFEKSSGQLISCNDPDHVQHFRENLFTGKAGVLSGGSSYSNIIDGGAARSIFTVSSPHPQTLFGRFGGFRFMVLSILHPLRICRMGVATVAEYVTDIFERLHYRKTRPWRVSEGLFPLIRIFCNVILRELQTFGVIADIYAGVPYIYTTYSGYDELGHHFGPGSTAALRSLRHTDKRIGEIMRMLRHAPGADYQLVILSDHGQTPGYPFHNRFGATLGDAISAFLKKNQQAAVSAGPLDFTRIQLGYLRDELDARPGGWRNRLYRATKNLMQKKIRALVPETIKVDQEGGVVVTYSSSLAHLYITGSRQRLNAIEVESAQPLLVRFLSQHKGIGFVLAKGIGNETWCYHDGGHTCASAESPPPEAELEFLRPYGNPVELWTRLCQFAMDDACGDLILFGAYDGERIACFDDQVGGHGSVGGEQSRPFLILPKNHPLQEKTQLVGNEFLYYDVFAPCRTELTP